MALTERTYTIPLRKEFRKAPKYKRAKKAVRAIREFLVKHMKTENVLIGPKLNLKVWEHGIKNPPHHVKVTVIKDDKEGIARAELFGFKFEKKEKKKKKEKAKGLAGKLQKKLGATGEKEAPKEIKSDKKELKKAEKLAAQKEKKGEEKTEEKEVKNEETKQETESPKKEEVEKKAEEKPEKKVEEKAEKTEVKKEKVKAAKVETKKSD